MWIAYVQYVVQDKADFGVLFLALFSAFDENQDGHIDFREIACGISTCCRGPLAERFECKVTLIIIIINIIVVVAMG